MGAAATEFVAPANHPMPMISYRHAFLVTAALTLELATAAGAGSPGARAAAGLAHVATTTATSAAA